MNCTKFISNRISNGKIQLKTSVKTRCYPKYHVKYNYQGNSISNDVKCIGYLNGSKLYAENINDDKYYLKLEETIVENKSSLQKVSDYVPEIPHKVNDDVIEKIINDAVLSSKNLSILFIKAILAGIFIGLGGVLCSSVGGDVPSLMTNNPGLQRAIFGALGFPVSIFLVTTLGASAMTGTIVMCAAAVYENKMKIQNAIQVLSVAWIGNALGLISIAILAASGSMDAVEPCMSIALHKAHATFGEVFARGIGGGILICSAICQAYAAKDGVSKILGIWFCISTYVMCGWEHGLANLFFFPCAILGNPGGPMTWNIFINYNLIPSTLGNILGGCILGAVLTIIHLKSK